MNSNNTYIWGMDIIWWCVWIVILVWIFLLPYNLPFQRKRKNSSIDILKNRYAAGVISKAEYLEAKQVLTQE